MLSCNDMYRVKREQACYTPCIALIFFLVHVAFVWVNKARKMKQTAPSVWIYVGTHLVSGQLVHWQPFRCSPDTVKSQQGTYYMLPERTCNAESAVWYSCSPLGKDTISRMLTRFSIVEEVKDVSSKLICPAWRASSSSEHCIGPSAWIVDMTSPLLVLFFSCLHFVFFIVFLIDCCHVAHVGIELCAIIFMVWSSATGTCNVAQLNCQVFWCCATQ